MRPTEELQHIEDDRKNLAEKIEKCSMTAKTVELKRKLNKLNSESRKIRRAFPKADRSVEFENYTGIGGRAYPNGYNPANKKAGCQ